MLAVYSTCLYDTLLFYFKRAILCVNNSVDHPFTVTRIYTLSSCGMTCSVLKESFLFLWLNQNTIKGINPSLYSSPTSTWIVQTGLRSVMPGSRLHTAPSWPEPNLCLMATAIPTLFNRIMKSPYWYVGREQRWGLLCYTVIGSNDVCHYCNDGSKLRWLLIV